MNVNFLVSVAVVSFLSAFGTASAQSSQQKADEDAIDSPSAPVLKWRFATNAPLISSPAIDDAVVYFGGLDSVFYAVDLQSGSLKWRLSTEGEIRSTPFVSDSLVYFTSGDGLLRCVDKVNGTVRWTFATQGERKSDFADYYQSSPRLAGGVIYFGSGDGYIYAVTAGDGSLVWRYKTGGVVHATPAIDSAKLFVGSFDGYFYALDLASGELLWRFKSVGHFYFPTGEFQGSPSVHNDLVFVGARDFNFYAIDQAKGYCHWNKSFSRGWAFPNVIHDTTLYIGTSDDRLLIAARPSSGREYWRSSLNFNIFGNIAVDDSIGYVGTLMGKLYCVSVRSGAIIWAFATDGYERNHLKYFKPDDSFRDDIFEIVKSDEAFIDVEYEIGAFFSTPALNDSILVVTSADGTVYCFRR